MSKFSSALPNRPRRAEGEAATRTEGEEEAKLWGECWGDPGQLLLLLNGDLLTTLEGEVVAVELGVMVRLFRAKRAGLDTVGLNMML